MRRMNNPKEKTAIIFWVALAVCLALPLIPYGRYILWPFSMLGVYAHELFHGLTALATGGRFLKMTVYPELGGLANIAVSNGFSSALVSAGGLIGPALVGGFLVILSRRYFASKFAVTALAVCLVASGLIWGATLFTIGFCLVGGAAMFGLAMLPHQLLRNAITQILGIQLCIENVADLDYMFTESFTRDGIVQISDTASIAEQLGGTYYIWGALIAAVTFAILFGAFVLSDPHR